MKPALTCIVASISTLALAGCTATFTATPGISTDGFVPSDYTKTIDVHSSAEKIYDNDFDTLDAVSTLVVEGTISELKYVNHSSFAYTLATVDVSRALRGKAPDTITVLFKGGYIPLRTFAEAESARGMDYSGYSDEELDSTIVHDQWEGEKEPHVGDQAIFFLKSGTAFPEFGDYYSIISGTDGEFSSNDGGKTYEYPNAEEDASGSYSAESLSKALKGKVDLEDARIQS